MQLRAMAAAVTAAFWLAASAAQAGDAGAPPANASGANDTASFSQLLNFDAATLSENAPTHSLREPGAPSAGHLDVSRSENPDGSSTVKVKKPVSSEWNANVGVDLGVVAPLADTYQPDQPITAGAPAAPSQAAWGSVAVVPNLATVDGRVDSGSDQGKLGTTFSHSVSLGSKLSVTLHDSLAVTDSLGVTGGTTIAPAGPPTTALPPPVTTPGTHEPVLSNERGLKFDFLSTGTSLSAGLASASADPVTHNTLSADQHLYGPLHVTTTLSDVGEATSSKSITAGMKFNW
jgi:hypothetical protein